MLSSYETSFIVFPSHCNHLRELIFGGEFMSRLDLAAASCIRRALKAHSDTAYGAVTHKADFEFKKPAYVGDELDLTAVIEGVGEKSITARVTARRDGEVIALSRFVFITIGEVGSLVDHPTYLPYVNHGLSIPKSDNE